VSFGAEDFNTPPNLLLVQSCLKYPVPSCLKQLVRSCSKDFPPLTLALPITFQNCHAGFGG
jgi:hypothetical protein